MDGIDRAHIKSLWQSAQKDGMTFEAFVKWMRNAISHGKEVSHQDIANIGNKIPAVPSDIKKGCPE